MPNPVIAGASPVRCGWNIAGEEFRLDITYAHQRFFYFEGHTLHTHPDLHFILISQGACRLHVPDAAPVDCPANTLVFINPRHPHTFSSGPGGVEHSCLVATLRRADGTAYEGPLQPLVGLERAPIRNWKTVKLDGDEAWEFVKQLKMVIALRGSGHANAPGIAAFSLFLLGVRLAFPEVFGQAPLRRRNEEIAAAVRRRVEERIDQPDLSVQALCTRLNLHRNRLNEVFRDVERVSVGEYILRRRLQRAVELLLMDYPVKQVYQRCGFGSHSHFTALFRKRFGCPPSRYREAGEGQPDFEA